MCYNSLGSLLFVGSPYLPIPVGFTAITVHDTMGGGLGHSLIPMMCIHQFPRVAVAVPGLRGVCVPGLPSLQGEGTRSGIVPAAGEQLWRVPRSRI